MAQHRGMNSFLERVQSEIAARQLIGRGERVLIAVSGGVDSMVLAHCLATEFSDEFPARFGVAHFNHQLRGHESDADEAFVRAAAASWDLPFFVGRAAVSETARSQKISVEMAARDLRHRFLADAARENGFSKIALAHHGDDQAELFFLRLLRGGGADGLAGMGWTDPSPANSSMSLIRPLLGMTRREIEQFAAEKSISFRNDSSNDSPEFERNRIRLELMPLIEAKWGTAGIRRAMEILGAESEFLESRVAAWLERREPEFDALPVALQRRIVWKQLLQWGVAPDFQAIETLRLKREEPVCVSGGVCLARTAAGELRAVKPNDLTFRDDSAALDLSASAGRWVRDDGEIFWRKEPVEGQPERGENREHFDAERVGERVVIRRWRPGDRFQPIGLPGPTKLQDLFTNLKVPAEERRRRWVGEAANGELFWVEGIRISDRFKLDKASRTRLKWEWRRFPSVAGAGDRC